VDNPVDNPVDNLWITRALNFFKSYPQKRDTYPQTYPQDIGTYPQTYPQAVLFNKNKNFQ
jgi:hypothetical protein